ncbi:MAG: Dihydroorotate dehydrogenase (quinone), mitochondrial [Bathelium mastoideum]|nr:MAG: Dihydroorotate dehydrogenase (quinone), mitochondrial [Bathelium mastoideum]
MNKTRSTAHLRRLILQTQARPSKSVERHLQTVTRPRVYNASGARINNITAQLPSIGRRYISSSSEAASKTSSPLFRLRNIFYGTSLALSIYLSYLYLTDTRAAIHTYLILPTFRLLYPDPEDAHHATTTTLQTLYTSGLYPRERGNPDAAGDLTTDVFSHALLNPLGISAGLDKHAELPDALFALGPALVELGGVTPLPQEGNPRPRVFRLPSQNALINRYGLNSDGADAVARRLRLRLREFAYQQGFGRGAEAEQAVLDGAAGVPPGALSPGRLLAVQVAKNARTAEGDVRAVTRDYVAGVAAVGRYADIVVVNVSSPNTPGLRSLQRVEPLTAILTGVVQAAGRVERRTKPAVMVKVSPDEDSEEQVRGICEAVWEAGVDGVIVGNTTKRRPEPVPKGYALPAKELDMLSEVGGYSGPQLFERTVVLVKRYRKLLDERPQRFPPELENRRAAVHSASSTDNPQDSVANKIEESKQRDVQNLKSPGENSTEGTQPLIQLPERHSASSKTEGHGLSLLSSKEQGTEIFPSSPTPAASDGSKVIFATGGIVNGKQALEVLNAGANLAQVYTAMVYSGASTITRIKTEMREEIRKQSRNKKA